MKNFVPKILDVKKNMYTYNRVKGEVFSNIINSSLFGDFLVLFEKFWKKKKIEQ